MLAQSVPSQAAVVRMIAGGWLSQTICVAVKLDVFELLRQRPRNAKDLALALGVHTGSLERMLRSLQTAGLVDCDDATWSVTETGRCLTSAGEPSLRGLAQFFASLAHVAAWGALEYSVRTGGSAFEHVNGIPVWEAGGFGEALSDAGSVLFRTLPDAYDLSAHATIVDVGRYCRSNPVAAVPAGADAYLLAGVLHNWSDVSCERILTNVRAAIAPDGVLLIGEYLIDPARTDALAALWDMELLVVTPSGRQRRPHEFRALLANCGFSLRDVRPLPSGAALLIADPA